LPLLATVEWVANDFRPIALAKTSRTNTATISHLFMDPSIWVKVQEESMKRSNAVKGKSLRHVS